MHDGSVEQRVRFERGIGAGAEESHGERCDRLHRRLKKLVKARGALDVAEADALREAQQLGMWRRYGYASLLEYLERELGYSPRVALERLRVANAIVDLPEIANAMEQGELSFSAARELTRVATPETEGEWMAATSEMNLREIEEKVSGHKRGERPTDPEDPSLRKRVLRLEVSPEMFAYWRQVQHAIEKEKGERIDDTTMVEVLGRAYMAERAGTARDVAPFQIATTICTTCKRGWQDGGGVTVEISPASVARAQCDAVLIGSIDDDETVASGLGVIAGTESVPRDEPEPDGASKSGRAPTPGAPTPASARTKAGAVTPDVGTRPKRTIPASMRRKVNGRDHGRCQSPGCRAFKNCEIHHIKPWSEGGEHRLDNLITLCESHHHALHEGALHVRFENGRFVFESEGRNNFTRATRAVETRLALKSLGWKPHEIKAAVEQTRTHVGTADLPLQDWIKIALRYCPSPLTG